MCDGTLESFLYRVQLEIVASSGDTSDQGVAYILNEHLTESAQLEAHSKCQNVPLLYLVRQLLKSVTQSTLQQIEAPLEHEQPEVSHCHRVIVCPTSRFAALVVSSGS